MNNLITSISIIIYEKLKPIVWYDTITGNYDDKYNNIRFLKIYNEYFNDNREFTYLHSIMEENIYYHIKRINEVQSLINICEFEGILKYVKK